MVTVLIPHCSTMAGRVRNRAAATFGRQPGCRGDFRRRHTCCNQSVVDTDRLSPVFQGHPGRGRDAIGTCRAEVFGDDLDLIDRRGFAAQMHVQRRKDMREHCTCRHCSFGNRNTIVALKCQCQGLCAVGKWKLQKR
jgi:hypothetical protein